MRPVIRGGVLHRGGLAMSMGLEAALWAWETWQKWHTSQYDFGYCGDSAQMCFEGWWKLETS